MQGDDLSICLFLAGIAATFLVGGVSQAGWRHRWFVTSLFVVAGLCLVAAAAWPWLKDLYPRVKAVLSQIAESPVAWFVVIMVGTMAALVRRPSQAAGPALISGETLNDKPDITAPQSASAVPTESQKLEYSLYVGRVEVNTQALNSDLYLESSFIVFNGSSVPLDLDGVGGYISLGKTVSATDAELIRLPAPSIREDTPLKLMPFRELMIIVSQRVQRSVAEEIEKALSDGGQVISVLESLDIRMRSSGDDGPIRLPIWDNITLQRVKEATVQSRVIKARMEEVLGSRHP